MTTRQISLGLLLLRLNLGVLMFFHGFAKLMPSGLDGIRGLMQSVGAPGFFAYGALVGEVVAPLMMVVGYRTRLAGVIMALNMVVAIFSAHSGDLMRISATGGYALELQMLYLVGGVVLFFTGAGKYAVSNRSRWD